MLLQNGSASGSYALLRTLVEYFIISTFIVKYPNNAQKYYHHIDVLENNYVKKLIKYEYEGSEYYKLYSSYIEDTNNRLSLNNYDKKDKKDYGWAKVGDKRFDNLYKMAKEVRLEEIYDKIYRHSSNMIHASTFRIINKIGMYDTKINKSFLFSGLDQKNAILHSFLCMNDINLNCIVAFLKLDGLQNEDKKIILMYKIQNSKFKEELLFLLQNKPIDN